VLHFESKEKERTNVNVVIGAGLIGQAIARRVSALSLGLIGKDRK